MSKEDIEEGLSLVVNFAKRGGLVPTMVQEDETGENLMLAYVNKEALDETIRSGMATFWSTSRNCLWKKGETSGDYLKIIDILTDCDQDALVYKVKLMGKGACHTTDKTTGASRKSCFYRKLDKTGSSLTKM